MVDQTIAIARKMSIHYPLLERLSHPILRLIASANTSGIIGDQSLSQHQTALEQIGTVHALPWLSVKDMQSSIRLLGELTDTSIVANTIVEDMNKAFRPQTGGDSVLLLLSGSVISKGQLWYIKPESIHGAVLEASGYQNAIPKGKDIPQMGLEELLGLNHLPSVLLVIQALRFPS